MLVMILQAEEKALMVVLKFKNREELKPNTEYSYSRNSLILIFLYGYSIIVLVLKFKNRVELKPNTRVH